MDTDRLKATWAEVAASSAATGSMEGKEQRFGVWASALFGAATTSTSTGAVNSLHESYSPLGGGVVSLGAVARALAIVRTNAIALIPRPAASAVESTA